MAASKSIAQARQVKEQPDEGVVAAIPNIEDRNTEELIIAVVGPVASGSSKVADLVGSILQHDYGYAVTRYRLSDLIRDNFSLLGESLALANNGAKRVEDLQNAGNQLRRRFGKEYLAAKAIEKIAMWRDQNASSKSAGGDSVPAKKRHVHILDSLKNPAELKLLRQTYGDIFWLVGVFAPIDVRRRRLTDQNGFSEIDLEVLIRNDYSEKEDYGQSVRDTFFQADMFVRNDQPNEVKLTGTLTRLLNTAT